MQTIKLVKDCGTYWVRRYDSESKLLLEHLIGADRFHGIAILEVELLAAAHGWNLEITEDK